MAATGRSVRLRRVFVAVPLAGAGRATRSRRSSKRSGPQADPEVRDVRWVRLDGLHLTLRFIGPVEESASTALAAAVDAAAAGPSTFDVTIEGAGAFPSDARPRTIWLGVTEGADRARRHRRARRGRPRRGRRSSAASARSGPT